MSVLLDMTFDLTAMTVKVNVAYDSMQCMAIQYM